MRWSCHPCRAAEVHTVPATTLVGHSVLYLLDMYLYTPLTQSQLLNVKSRSKRESAKVLGHHSQWHMERQFTWTDGKGKNITNLVESNVFTPGFYSLAEQLQPTPHPLAPQDYCLIKWSVSTVWVLAVLKLTNLRVQMIGEWETKYVPLANWIYKLFSGRVS